VVAVGNDLMWKRLCDALELPELAAQADLDDNAARRVRRTEITDLVAERLATRPAHEWLDVLGAAGIPVSLVQSLSEVLKDPQVLARGSVMPVPGSAGDLVSVRSPFRLASIPEPRNERFPELGEGTRAVLDAMGFSDDEIADLAADGSVELPSEVSR
jgi:crotonobetainyl-CoA:carnitine CoA-transferase CaiB-like acyl-CoA transferase